MTPRTQPRPRPASVAPTYPVGRRETILPLAVYVVENNTVAAVPLEQAARLVVKEKSR